MSYSNSIIFGPIPSRRFGISLGVDLSPASKQCNFDCLYCELKPAKTVDSMQSYPSVQEVINAISDSIKKHPKIDVITVTANGEPTLYPHLDELIVKINQIKGEAKTLILSNGSTIYKPEIFDALLKFDTVKLSLDCVSEQCFKKLDRVHKGIEINKIIDAMVEFKKATTNFFVLEILFVKDLNDKADEIQALYQAIQRINPHRVDIGTIDRPPAYKVQPVSFETLEFIANSFKGINVNIAYKNRPKQTNSFSNEEILRLLERRPLTFEDIENLFDEPSRKRLETLVKDSKISVVDSSGVKFYKFLG
ncbi:radical SAM protein [Candidatus Marinarcus aquaticus]|uniref:Radical SAM protein n=1 Tax=Candidatus Marinarcus aquaticus TaxID=2044504 RepID=A0A4Q0XMV9_9BACT|nr:radical SAM protein [Candidatus Marinarcus aquaticus]RXJ55326.1 radical SAM protein [Candidatus Marinarcus aquaticus]